MNKTNKYKLLIIFINGNEKVIEDVEEYGTVGTEHCSVLHYVKNGVRSFVPVHEIRYFGEYGNYYGE